MTAPERASEPGRETWKRLTPDERRAQLIRIAQELFQSRPYEEIGVIDVAKAAGITHGLIYHYFPSKEALFIAAFEARAQELLDRCESDPSAPLPDQAIHGVRGYLDFCEEHRVAYLNLFRGPTAGHADFFRICEATRATLIERFIHALGFTDEALPATRLSLRGYLGYSETIVLEWLERKAVSRPSIEALILAVIRTAIEQGLTLDGHAGVELPDLSVLANQ